MQNRGNLDRESDFVSLALDLDISEKAHDPGPGPGHNRSS